MPKVLKRPTISSDQSKGIPFSVKQKNNVLIRELESADSEKMVEQAYHKAFDWAIEAIGGTIQKKATRTSSKKGKRPTDGLINGDFRVGSKIHVFRLIVEFKKQRDFTIHRERCEVISQVVYYLKLIEDSGGQIPNVVFVGDKKSCFTFHTNVIVDELTKNYDWSIAPSEVYKHNKELVDNLDKNIELQKQCSVYLINENFQLIDIVEKVKQLVSNTKVKLRINEKMVATTFDYFSMHILLRNNQGASIYEPRKQVELFMSMILDIDECFQHPNKKNIIKINNEDIKANVPNFIAFVENYDFSYNAEEKKEFTAICDRLIEDSDRRYRGDFYTPTAWVNEAHSMVSEHLGTDWKKDCVVWDSAWGTGNLTRDYKFNSLYCSTLHEHDLEIGSRYNREAVKFQYDFLNDDIDEFRSLKFMLDSGVDLQEKHFYGTKLWQQAPGLIRELLSGKQLVFLINPPYGRSSGTGYSQANIEKGSAKTLTSDWMRDEKLGASASQLYAQFIFRVCTIKQLFKNVTLAVFAKDLYKTSSSFREFRKYLRNNFGYVEGMLFQASDFADASGAWAVDFSVWEDINDYSKTDYEVSLKKNTESGIHTIRNKSLYNIRPEQSLSNFIEPCEHNMIDFPKMSGGLSVRETDFGSKFAEGALGTLISNANNVAKNTKSVYIISGATTENVGKYFITKDNFKDCMSVFAARRLITDKYASWMNDKEEYMKPNKEHALYRQWESDAVVYSMFNTNSSQSSLRDVKWEGSTWNIFNNLFFLEASDIKEMALKHRVDSVYNDLEKFSGDRVIAEYLKNTKLSRESIKVIKLAIKITDETFEFREEINNAFPEFHILSWDAGWMQIKKVASLRTPSLMKEFGVAYKELGDKMRPLVGELGFIKDIGID